MAALVFVCPTGSQMTSASLGAETPRCTTGAGSWQDFSALYAAERAADVPFWEKSIPAEQVGPLLGAITLCFAAAWVSKFVGDFIK